jgi:hypothetical protein
LARAASSKSPVRLPRSSSSSQTTGSSQSRSITVGASLHCLLENPGRADLALTPKNGKTPENPGFFVTRADRKR